MGPSLSDRHKSDEKLLTRPSAPQNAGPDLAHRLADRISGFLLPAALLAVLLGTWEGLFWYYSVPDYLLPTPSTFLPRLMTDSGRLGLEASRSLFAVLIGFAAGTAMAIPVGLLIALYPSLERNLYHLIVFIKTMPKVAIAPLLIIWLGYGTAPKAVLVAVVTFLPVLVDSIAGFKIADERVFYVTRSIGANPWQTFRYVRMPAAMPHIFSGMKTSMAMSVAVVVVVEFLSSTDGLGYVAMRATDQHDLPLMFAAIAVAAAMGLALSMTLASLESVVMPWLKNHGLE